MVFLPFRLAGFIMEGKIEIADHLSKHRPYHQIFSRGCNTGQETAFRILLNRYTRSANFSLFSGYQRYFQDIKDFAGEGRRYLFRNTIYGKIKIIVIIIIPVIRSN
jgi:hypothetical protein